MNEKMTIKSEMEEIKYVNILSSLLATHLDGMTRM